MALHELALFAGAGGGLLASRHLGWRTVAAVEIDPYCREVLLARQRDGLLDLFPIWDDIRTFRADTPELVAHFGLFRLHRRTLVITAGFPCQPFSVAGRGDAETDDRNLWPETSRVIREIRPRYVYLENVPGLLSGSHGYYGRVVGELAESGYDAEWGVLSAQAVGARHRRGRLWILATHSERDGLRFEPERLSGGRPGELRGEGQAVTGDDGETGNAPDSGRRRREQGNAPMADTDGT